jgi:exosortase/archaeosortase family protein
VPTDITPHLTSAHKFVLRGVTASLGLFALLRFAWIEAHVVLPFTQMQAALAARWFGNASSPVEATLACSGTDALALCFGAVLAYPATWRTRLAGVAGGAVLIVGLNTIRIGTLGLVAASPRWFTALHLYVWPAALTLAIAGYVFAWMRYADRAAPPSLLRAVPQPSRRFIILTIVFLLVFLAASPFYLEDARVLALASLVARGAAAVLRVAGIPAHAAANVLWTGSGGFLVTQECIASPLIPVYLAAVCAYAPTWRRLTAWVLATLPLFLALGVARLLLVALPAAVASPLFWVHAFYQLLVGAIVVWAAALWRNRRAAGRHALAGLLGGVVCGMLAAPLLGHVVAASGGASLDDPQGAIAFLPAFQIALYVALCAAAWTGAGWARSIAGLAILAFMVPASTLVLRALAVHAGVAPHVRDIRAWAIAGPVLIFAAMMSHAPSRR